SLALFSIIALTAIFVLSYVGVWYKNHLSLLKSRPKKPAVAHETGLSKTRVALSIGILLVLIFSKYFYLVSLSSYYTFYLMSKFGVSVQAAQVYLFVFLGAVAAG